MRLIFGHESVGRVSISRLGLLALAPLVLAACGQQPPPQSAPPARSACLQLSTLLGYSPEPSASATSNRCLDQALDFSGELVGHAGAAVLDVDSSATPCDAPLLGAGWQPTRLDLALQGQAYMLTLRPPGTYQPGKSTTPDAAGAFALQLRSHPAFLWQSRSGQFSVARDGVSGTLDLELARAGSTQPSRVRGAWRCGQPGPARTAGGGPCGAALAMQSPAPGGPPASSACLPQQLQLTGAYPAAVSEALNDPTRPSPDAPDNICGALAGDDSMLYVATLDFAALDQQGQVVVRIANPRGIAYPDFGPTSVPLSGVGTEPTVQVTLGALTWSSTAGRLSIAFDHHSGTVDMDLASRDGSSAEHLAGSWRCR